MERQEQGINLYWWPSPQDYNEAVQNPAITTSDSELRDADVSLGPLGIPQPVCGAFASVYKMRIQNKEIAVRCFLRDVQHQAERYAEISKYVLSDDLPYTVDFQYLNEGIQVNGKWFPLLKMEWVSGQTLDEYLLSNLNNPAALKSVGAKFLRMCQDLQAAGIAHGDLQHGNIIVTPECELRLVDYDGMYVPSMSGYSATELGHRNYQHPRRSAKDFGASLDNFSAWIMYTSIQALAVDPGLAKRMGFGDDCLLFKGGDFADSARAPVFHALENAGDAELRKLSRFVRSCLTLDASSVPPLSFEVESVDVADLSEDQLPERGNVFRGSLSPQQSEPQGLVSQAASSSGIEPELRGPVPRIVYSRYADTFLPSGALLALIICLLHFLSSVWPLWLLLALWGCWLHHPLWREYWLVKHGTAVRAEIIRIDSPVVPEPPVMDPLSIGVVDFTDFQTVVMSFKSTSASGTETIHQCQAYHMWAKSLGGVGAQVTLLCAPNNPRDVLVYRLSKFGAS